MSEKLLPCPFCGGEAEEVITAKNTSDPKHRIRCTKCRCQTSETVASPEHIRKWNTRAYEDMGTLECYECRSGYPMVRERTCHVEQYFDFGVLNARWKLSCGHTSTENIAPHYCPWCGAKVVE